MLKPELLAPAGNLDILKIAFLYGADAVYCGTPKFAMRSRVGFDTKSLKEGIDYAHSINKKVYVTLNAFPHSLDIKKVQKHALDLAKLKPDAFIVADPGLINFLRSATKIPLHLSTQANTTNQLTANFWQEQGISRIVLARELSLKEIRAIYDDCSQKNNLPTGQAGEQTNDKRRKSNGKEDVRGLSSDSPSSVNGSVELEAFVHGAMCMAYSGRCQISNYMANRDPNMGDCIQACRFKYKMYGLEEELRPGEFFPVYEDEEGTHILNSKDLSMIEYIPELIKAGVISFKIEGRLKTEYYVATVVSAYRKAIDLYFSNPKKYKKDKKLFSKEIAKTSSRGFTTSFYLNKPDKETNNYKTSRAAGNWGYIGRVIEFDQTNKKLKFEAKNHLLLGSKLEIMTPTEIIKYDLKMMMRNNESVEVAHAGNIIEIPFDQKVEKDSLIRVFNSNITRLDSGVEPRLKNHK